VGIQQTKVDTMRLYKLMRSSVGKKVVSGFALIIIVIFVVTGRGIGGEKPPGLTFLRLGMDARGIALGGAMTSIGAGLSSLLWNPAGLVSGISNEIVFSHMRGFDDINSEFIAFLLKRGTDKAFAISLLSNNIGGIEQRTSPTELPNGIISAHDFYTGITYSQRINSNLQAGITGKYLFQKLFFDSASGFSVDLGAQYKIEDKNVQFGLALKNIGSMGAFLEEKPSLPTLLQAGTGYKISRSDHNLTITGEYELLFNGNNSARFGVEYEYYGRYSFRAGYLTGFEDRGLSVGTGMALQRFVLDYAFLPDVTAFGNQHIFSLRLKI